MYWCSSLISFYVVDITFTPTRFFFNAVLLLKDFSHWSQSNLIFKWMLFLCNIKDAFLANDFSQKSQAWVFSMGFLCSLCIFLIWSSKYFSHENVFLQSSHSTLGHNLIFTIFIPFHKYHWEWPRWFLFIGKTPMYKETTKKPKRLAFKVHFGVVKDGVYCMLWDAL